MANIFGTNANHLVALAALLRERNVTAAAKRVGVTQSAMSSTLAQLRELLNDPLLVRVGRSMQPTPRALALLEPLERGLVALEEVLTPPRAFDPATSEARFALAMDDRADILIVPHLLRRIRGVAPRVEIQVHAWGRHHAPPGLATGDLDGAIGVFPEVGTSSEALRRLRKRWPSIPQPLAPGHHAAPLFELGLGTLVRADHPRVGKTLDLDTFCALDHVLVTEEPWATGIIDDALARHKRRRRIAARVPRALGVGWIVAETDLLATIDLRLARMHAQAFGLRVLDPPVDVPSAALTLLWHDRTDRDPARHWLRAQIIAGAVACHAATESTRCPPARTRRQSARQSSSVRGREKRT